MQCWLKPGASPLCVQGDTLALPFPADVFDLVALITALEFIADPNRARLICVFNTENEETDNDDFKAVSPV